MPRVQTAPFWSSESLVSTTRGASVHWWMRQTGLRCRGRFAGSKLHLNNFSPQVIYFPGSQQSRTVQEQASLPSGTGAVTSEIPSAKPLWGISIWDAVLQAVRWVGSKWATAAPEASGSSGGKCERAPLPFEALQKQKKLVFRFLTSGEWSGQVGKAAVEVGGEGGSVPSGTNISALPWSPNSTQFSTKTKLYTPLQGFHNNAFVTDLFQMPRNPDDIIFPHQPSKTLS